MISTWINAVYKLKWAILWSISYDNPLFREFVLNLHLLSSIKNTAVNVNRSIKCDLSHFVLLKGEKYGTVKKDNNNNNAES